MLWRSLQIFRMIEVLWYLKIHFHRSLYIIFYKWLLFLLPSFRDAVFGIWLPLTHFLFFLMQLVEKFGIDPKNAFAF